jgi:hypothetical protein
MSSTPNTNKYSSWFFYPYREQAGKTQQKQYVCEVLIVVSILLLFRN